MFLETLCRSQSAEYIEAGLIAVGGFGAHALEALRQPLLFSEGGDMHKFGAKAATVGLLQSIDNLAQSCFLLADIEGTGLECGIQVSLSEAVEVQVQVRHIFANHQPQGIQIGLLVAAESVGADQLNNLNLLALVLEMNTAGAGRRCRAGLATAEQFEMLDYGRVGDIRCNTAIDSRQSVKKAAPLFRNSVAVVQVNLVEIFNVRGITTREVGGAKKVLQRALRHWW